MLNLRRRDVRATHHTGASGPRSCPQPTWCWKECSVGQALSDRQAKIVIRATGYLPRPIEETATVSEQAAGGVQMLQIAATALDCFTRQGGSHGVLHKRRPLVLSHCRQGRPKGEPEYAPYACLVNSEPGVCGGWPL